MIGRRDFFSSLSAAITGAGLAAPTSAEPIKPKDSFVITFSKAMGKQQIDALSKALREEFPDNKFLVINNASIARIPHGS